jgi:hypothetical protein
VEDTLAPAESQSQLNEGLDVGALRYGVESRRFFKGLFEPSGQYVSGDIVFVPPNVWGLIREGSSARSAGGFYICNAPAKWQSYLEEAIPGEIKRWGHFRPGNLYDVPGIVQIDVPKSCPFSSAGRVGAKLFTNQTSWSLSVSLLVRNGEDPRNQAETKEFKLNAQQSQWQEYGSEINTYLNGIKLVGVLNGEMQAGQRMVTAADGGFDKELNTRTGVDFGFANNTFYLATREMS